MARFLVVVLPLRSHLHPALAIGRALVAAGHEVAWCGPESDLRPLVGPDAVIHPTGKRYYREYSESGMAALRLLWSGYLVPFNRFVRAPAEVAITAYRPDVVLADQYALTAALAAHRHGVAWATLATSMLELVPPDEPDLPRFLRDQLDAVWRMSGLDPVPDLDPRFSPHLVLALTTPALTGPVTLPATCVQIGPAIGPRPGGPEFPFPPGEPDVRTVLVTVGTLSEHMAADFHDRLVRALAPLAGRVRAIVVASAGVVPDPPAYVHVTPFAPLLDWLPRLDALVCHGGMGTVTEALAHGVPLVVAPMRHDQPVVAGQVVAAGAGIEVDFADPDPAPLTSALAAVLDDPRYREGARQIGASFAAAGGIRAAVDELTRLAGHCGQRPPTANLGPSSTVVEDRDG